MNMNFSAAPFWLTQLRRLATPLLLVLALLPGCKGNEGAKLEVQPAAGETSPVTAALTVELANRLGVKATVNASEFFSGNDTWKDNEHDFITQELNDMGGHWPAEEGGKGRSFSDSRLAIELDKGRYRGQFLLVPWQLFRSATAQQSGQLIEFNDGTKLKGSLRTILTDSTGAAKRTYELGGATSIRITRISAQAPGNGMSAQASKGEAGGQQWSVLSEGGQAVVITRPRFVFSRFHVTSGGGIHVEKGYYETKVSEQFGVGPRDLNGNGKNDSVSAAFSDFESITLGGGGREVFGMPITVKTRDGQPVAGTLAATPFGLDAFSNEYLNRTTELAGDLPNGCTIVFSFWNTNRIKLDRVH